MAKCEVFGQRLCTYCGRTKMYYFKREDGRPIGICMTCNNDDYCDNETVEQVKIRFGNKLKTPDIKFIEC